MLFLLYINNFPPFVTCNIATYAGDTDKPKNKIFDNASVPVIHKNVINHCFSCTQSKYYNLTFPFPEKGIHQAQPFTNSPIQQSDPSIIYLPNPQTPINLSKNTHITNNMAIKVTTHQHLLSCHNLVHYFIRLLLFIY